MSTAGLDFYDVWSYLWREIDRRQQARYAMHAHAYEQLDKRVDRRIASSGNDGDTAVSQPGGTRPTP